MKKLNIRLFIGFNKFGNIIKPTRMSDNKPKHVYDTITSLKKDFTNWLNRVTNNQTNTITVLFQNGDKFIVASMDEIEHTLLKISTSGTVSVDFLTNSKSIFIVKINNFTVSELHIVFDTDNIFIVKFMPNELHFCDSQNTIAQPLCYFSDLYQCIKNHFAAIPEKDLSNNTYKNIVTHLNSMPYLISVSQVF